MLNQEKKYHLSFDKPFIIQRSFARQLFGLGPGKPKISNEEELD